MIKEPKFIGAVSKNQVKDAFTDSLWTPKVLGSLPGNLLTPPDFYLFTTVSGYPSLATVAYGVEYVSALDNWRYEYESRNPDEPLINIDHLVYHPINCGYAVYQLPISYHWPKPDDSIVQALPNQYKYPIEAVLKQKRK